MKKQEKIFEFNINIGVPSHDVNSDTFLTSLTCITDIISIINNDIAPARKLEIRGKALTPGSFDCACFIQDMVSCSAAVLPMIASLDVKYYKELINIVIDILRIKQLLKGKEPVKKEINGLNIILENSYGNTINVNVKAYDYFKGNQSINDAVTKNFEKLNSDSDVFTYSIKTEDHNFNSDRSDFVSLQQQRVVDEKKIKEIFYENELLYIYKIVWDASNKWGFVWNGTKIQAYIRDNNFFKRIDAGEKFSKGDTIKACVKIYQIFDASINNWINDTFEIIEIKEHTLRPEQTELIFEE